MRLVDHGNTQMQLTKTLLSYTLCSSYTTVYTERTSWIEIVDKMAITKIDWADVSSVNLRNDGITCNRHKGTNVLELCCYFFCIIHWIACKLNYKLEIEIAAFFLLFITSFYGHFTAIETLWKVVKWSMKWPYSIQWEPIEMFCFRHIFFLWSYGVLWSSFNIRWRSCAPICHWLRDFTLSSNVWLLNWSWCCRGGDTPTKKIAKSENEPQECFETPFEVHSNHIIFAHACKVYNSFILSMCAILSKPEMESGM